VPHVDAEKYVLTAVRPTTKDEKTITLTLDDIKMKYKKYKVCGGRLTRL
jgi:hypothetical protein